MEPEDTPATLDGPATLATVAASAGVSIATVSKVLNGRADVGPGTRARVQSLLQEHNYAERRSSVPRSGAVAQPTVEVAFHGRQTNYSTEVLHGILGAATEAGVAVAVSLRPRHLRSAGVEGTADWIRRLVDAGRLAVIDVVDDAKQGDLTGLSRSRLPLVVIDPQTLPRRQVSSVGATNFAGGLAATQHLVELGHRRIAYVNGESSSAYNQARMHGYLAALEAAGIEVPKTYIRHGGSHFEDGIAGGVVFDQRNRPTAVFAATDELAAGVIEAARTRRLRVPEDVSVVGFDDAGVARVLSPPLTTVRQPLHEMGRVALLSALRLAAGEKLDSHRVELATELVLRSSTAPPA